MDYPRAYFTSERNSSEQERARIAGRLSIVASMLDENQLMQKGGRGFLPCAAADLARRRAQFRAAQSRPARTAAACTYRRPRIRLIALMASAVKHRA